MVFSKLKAAHQKRKEKTAKLREERGNPVWAETVEYLGGYASKPKAKGVLIFHERQAVFSGPGSKFTIQNTDVNDIAIEGQEQVGKRVTVTRMLATGLFAFAIQKKTIDKKTYVILEMADGQEAIFLIDNKNPMEVKARFNRVLPLFKHTGKE